MKLTFIHGWGFDRNFWRPLAALLPQHEHSLVDLGFFGEPDGDTTAGGILVGHSLGFHAGLRRRSDWQAWIAINSFPRFVEDGSGTGCVPAAALRTMKKQLARDAKRTLADFYQLIDAEAPAAAATPDVQTLAEGLDVLNRCDAGTYPALAQCPGLILASPNDPLVPMAASEALATPNARLAVHETGEHLLPQSAPAWCADAITGFLRSAFSEAA